MRNFIKQLALIFCFGLGALPALAQGNFTENLTVTSTPVSIVVGKNVSSVIIRENSNAPTANFIITPAAVGSVAVNLAAGQGYQFSAGSQQYASGTVLGTIASVGAGPFTFVLMESNAANASLANYSLPGSIALGGPISGTIINATTGFQCNGVALGWLCLADHNLVVRYDTAGTFSQPQNLGTSWQANGSTSGTTVFQMPAAAGNFNFKFPQITADDTAATLGLPNIFTAQQTFPNGSAATPGIAFAAAANTGFRSQSSTQLVFVSGGTDRVAFQAAGSNSISSAGYAWTNSTTNPTGAPDTGLGRSAAGIVSADTNSAGNGLGQFIASGYQTKTNCAAVGTAASPSVASCTAAPAGLISCATNATATCRVNTTLVTANSEIFVHQVTSTAAGTRLSVTCNTTLSTIRPDVTAQVNGTSFDFGLTQPVTNPNCYYYHIIN